MSSLGPKQQVFASLAEIAQALGHAHRLELLEYLGQIERSVEDLAGRAGLNIANTSRHLQLLRRIPVCGAAAEHRDMLIVWHLLPLPSLRRALFRCCNGPD